MTLTLSRLALAALFGTGVWTLQVFARSNGLFTLMEGYKDKLTLPHTNISFDPTFTGVEAIDDVFAFVLMFFWPIVDGSQPALSLASFAFGGQAIAAWAVTMVEGLRTGNSWRAISFTAIYGMAAQLLGMGMVAPLYFLVHSFTSPVPSTPTIKSISPTFCASLATIPASITISYILPMVLMTLPAAPGYLTLDQKLIAHNLWQVFPLTCSLTHLILTTIWPYNPAPTPRNLQRYFRFVYRFALALAAPAHVAAGTITVSAYVFPALFNARVVPGLQPWGVWVPTTGAFENGVSASSVGEGALWFIQWDYALVGAAYLVWGVMVRQQARRFVGSKEGFGVAGLLMVVTRLVVLGPVGAAVAYVWERDELVLEAGEVLERKKLQ